MTGCHGNVMEMSATYPAIIYVVHALPMKEGMGAAKYPGEIEYGCKQINEKEGIVLPETLVEDLIKTGEKLGVDGNFLKETVTDRQ